MAKEKKSKDQRIAELEQQLQASNSQLVHQYHFADAALAEMVKRPLMGSGVILTISALSGKKLVEPVLIRNGLSAGAIAAIRSDLQRSYLDCVVYKPKGITTVEVALPAVSGGNPTTSEKKDTSS